MASKQELQTELKMQHGINKNISQALSTDECVELLSALQQQASVRKITESFAAKNLDLGNSNRHYGQLSGNATKKLQAAKEDYERLEQQLTAMEEAKANLQKRKQGITAETQKLESEIEQLSESNQALESKVQTLTTHNDELLEANTHLKKDNKELKNIVDQIRLRLARDTQKLLEYEDSEIRKALIRLFRWTLG